jgi:hypothetical protein
MTKMNALNETVLATIKRITERYGDQATDYADGELVALRAVHHYIVTDGRDELLGSLTGE